MDLHASWHRTWARLGAPGDGAPVYADLVQRYGQPQRRYHTLQHLAECIGWFEAVMDQAREPGPVEAALWFHDAVYAPDRHDNEERSAELARVVLSRAGVSADAAATVERLVLATRHTVAAAGSPDEQLLVDIDLAILGAPAARFAEYERQIRDEYSFVPQPLFRSRRRAILSSFLDRPRIYQTASLRCALEEQARANLSGALQRLGG